MELEKIFGDRIKSLRIANNLTQQQLGDMIGLSKQAINDIEKCRRQTTLARALSLAHAFNTTIEYLIGDTDNIQRPDNF